jgi:hypothetical protein
MIAQLLRQLAEKAKKYVDVQLQLLKLNLLGQASVLLSSMVFIQIVLFLFFCVLIFGGITLIELLTEGGMSRWAASLITFGSYLLFLLVVILLRKPISNMFSGVFLRTLTGEKETDSQKEED